MRSTIRLRLTLLYGLVFLVTGAVLLTIGYLLVRHNLEPHENFRGVLRRLGLALPVPLGPKPLLLFTPNSQELRVAQAVRAQLRADALHRLVLEYVIALGVMTLVSGVAGWLLAGRALRPLRRIIATAKRVSGENLNERIALRGPQDELKELADTFDGMLSRLEATFASQRSFVANASHELRTPLAIMRTEIDVALADPDADPEELRRMGEAVRETVDRCEALLEGLLTLARSQGGVGAEESIDLAGLAGDVVTDLHARAQERQIEIRDSLAPAWVQGEPALLERLIANLLDNAIRHNQPHGFVEVATATHDGRVSFRVVNSGEVIEPGEAETLTEPFRRLHREEGGFGLGLSIVRSVTLAHSGAVQLSPRPSGGLEVVVALPGISPGTATAMSKNPQRALTEK